MHATESLMLNAITLFRIGWREVRRYIIDIRALLPGEKKNFSVFSYFGQFSFIRKVIRSANLRAVAIGFRTSLFRRDIRELAAKRILNLERYRTT